MTGTITATTFSGALAGNATSATTATALATTLDTSISNTRYIAFVGTSTTSSSNTFYTHGPLTYSPTSSTVGNLSMTGTITATTFSGALAGNATSATTATKLTTTVTGNFARSVALVDTATNNFHTHAPLTYTPVSASLGNLSMAGTMTATTFSGALAGNAASAGLIFTAPETATSGTKFITFVGANAAGGSNSSLLAHNALTFTPGATSAVGSLTVGGSITATSFVGTVSIATTATNLAAGAGGSIPYQSSAGTTVMLANGTAGQVLTSAGGTAAPTWSTLRGYTVPFGITILTILTSLKSTTYLFANVGAAGLVADGSATNPLITNSDAQNKFVVPVDGTISVMTVAWDSASNGTITIFRNSILIYTSAAAFTTNGGQIAITLTTSVALRTVTAGQYIEVKANRGASDDSVESFGGLNVVLYFT